MSASDWTTADPDKVAEQLQSAVEVIEKSPYEVARRESLLYDLELFLGTKLTNLYQLSGPSYNEGYFNADQQIAFNLCYSITNTIRNRICSFRPRAQFITNDGDHRAQQAAEDMTDKSDGWAHKANYQGEASFGLRDTLTGDGGVLKMYVDNDRLLKSGKNKGKRTADICIARFPSWEFMFEEAESQYRNPECGYHVYYLPVEHAARTFQIDELELKKWTVSMPQGVVYVPNRDMVRVIDAYQRRGDEPGRHVIAVGNKLVNPLGAEREIDGVTYKKGEVEPWDYDGPPFIRKVFDERPIGIWGDGVVKRLRALQLELIEWQTALRDSHALTSQQVWLTQQNEDAPPKINNATIRQHRFTNVPPQVINPAAVNSEMYKYYDVLTQAGYQILGVSQFIAAGTKQPGINSAVAIRESSELQTDRLALLSQTWEDMRVESAEWWRNFAKGLVKDDYVLSYRAIRRGTFLELTMEDADREYEIRAFPSSLFGQTISGRLERATELIEGKFISQEDAMKALDMPDLQPIVKLQLSEVYAMETLVDNILRDGKYVTPDEQFDPGRLYEYARKRYFLTQDGVSNYSETNLALLRKLLATMKPKAEAAKAAASPPAVTPPPAGGASPEAVAAEGTPAAGANGAMAA